MKITDVQISLRDDPKLKALITITFDDNFVVHGLKVIQGKSGMFVAMPSRRSESGGYRDVAHPLNRAARKWLEESVLEMYVQETHRRDGGLDDGQTTGVRSPIAPAPDPMQAAETRRLESDVVEPGIEGDSPTMP